MFLTTVVLLSCKQNDSKKKREHILKLCKEAAGYMEIGMLGEMNDSSKAAVNYRKALNKFIEALNVDKSQKKIGIYLPDLYNKLNMTDSANYWKEWLGEEYR